MPFNKIRKSHPDKVSRTVAISLVAIILTIWVAAFFTGPSAARNSGMYTNAGYALPPEVIEGSFTFMGEKVPLDKQEVQIRVLEQLNYLLMDRRSSALNWFDQMDMYGPIIKRALQKEGAPEDLVYLSCILSGFSPTAISKSGGRGWWALGSEHSGNTRSSANWVTTKNWDDRRDPDISTEIAANILKSLKENKVIKTWSMAICAYVDGVKSVEAALKKNRGFRYWDIVAPTFSELIIPRLIALKIIHHNRSFYALDTPGEDEIKVDTIDGATLKKELPLYAIAKWVGTNPRFIWLINPGVSPSTGKFPTGNRKRGSTFPLRVPKGYGDIVLAKLKSLGYL